MKDHIGDLRRDFLLQIFDGESLNLLERIAAGFLVVVKILDESLDHRVFGGGAIQSQALAKLPS